MTDERPSQFTIDEFTFTLKRYVKELLEPHEITPVVKPTAYLLGGQSGAGKTTLHNLLSKRMDVRPVVINGDNFRESHPRFGLLQEKYGKQAVEHTAAWSGKMTEHLIDAFSKLSYNLIIEGTLRTSEVPLRTARLLRERGYRVSLAIMAVKPEISLISCQIRYEQMRLAGTTPRATDPAHHQKIVNDIVANLATLEESGLFDSVELYTRSEERIYPAEGETASHALEQHLFGPWTEAERSHYNHLCSILDDLKETPSY